MSDWCIFSQHISASAMPFAPASPAAALLHLAEFPSQSTLDEMSQTCQAARAGWMACPPEWIEDGWIPLHYPPVILFNIFNMLLLDWTVRNHTKSRLNMRKTMDNQGLNRGKIGFPPGKWYQVPQTLSSEAIVAGHPSIWHIIYSILHEYRYVKVFLSTMGHIQHRGSCPWSLLAKSTAGTIIIITMQQLQFALSLQLRYTTATHHTNVGIPIINPQLLIVYTIHLWRWTGDGLLNCYTHITCVSLFCYGRNDAKSHRSLKLELLQAQNLH